MEKDSRKDSATTTHDNIQQAEPDAQPAEAKAQQAADNAGGQETAAQQADGGQKDRQSTIELIKESVREDDPKLSAAVNLRTVLGGDILYAELVRRQLWLIVIVVIFTIVYVAFRYQCQQDMIAIDKLETELKDAKYRALSSSSTLTERCRESHILEILKQRKDSLLQVSDQPPYIINVPED